jgi:hypothetical protein
VQNNNLDTLCSNEPQGKEVGDNFPVKIGSAALVSSKQIQKKKELQSLSTFTKIFWGSFLSGEI